MRRVVGYCPVSTMHIIILHSGLRNRIWFSKKVGNGFQSKVKSEYILNVKIKISRTSNFSLNIYWPMYKFINYVDFYIKKCVPKKVAGSRIRHSTQFSGFIPVFSPSWEFFLQELLVKLSGSYYKPVRNQSWNVLFPCSLSWKVLSNHHYVGF